MLVSEPATPVQIPESDARRAAFRSRDDTTHHHLDRRLHPAEPRWVRDEVRWTPLRRRHVLQRRARAIRGRALQRDRGERVRSRGRGTQVDVLDRCRHRLLQQHASLPATRLSPARRRGSGGRADQLLRLQLPATPRRAPVRGGQRGLRLPVEQGPPARAPGSRGQGNPPGTHPPAQPGVSGRRVGLDVERGQAPPAQTRPHPSRPATTPRRPGLGRGLCRRGGPGAAAHLRQTQGHPSPAPPEVRGQHRGRSGPHARVRDRRVQLHRRRHQPRHLGQRR